MFKLDPRPARTDHTDRELTTIIGGLLGSLMLVADMKTLRRAVRWWAETDQAWEQLDAARGTLSGRRREDPPMPPA